MIPFFKSITGQDIEATIGEITIKGKLVFQQSSRGYPDHKPEVPIIEDHNGKHILRVWEKIVRLS